MPARAKNDQAHQHSFGERSNECPCGAKRIHRRDYAEQCDAWDQVYERAKDSVSCKSYKVCALAWYQGHKDVVRECAQRASHRLQINHYQPKPTFADPRGQSWRQLFDDNNKPTDYLFHTPERV